MARTPARPRKASKPVQKRAQVSERSESGDDELDSDFEPEVAEQLHDVEDEATWDGLSGVDGKPVAVFLFKIANSMRKKLVAQIEDLGGMEVMLAEEADVLVAPELTTKLRAKFRAARPVLRRVDWLERLWDERHIEEEVDETTLQAKKKSTKDRPSTKRWASEDDRNLAQYIALRCPGESDSGRQGRKIYRDLLDSTQLEVYRWASGYGVEQLRMRYKHHRDDFDKAITQIVLLHPEYLTSHLRYVPASQADWDLVDSLNPNSQSVVVGYPETPTPRSLTNKRTRDEYNNRGETSRSARREGSIFEANGIEIGDYNVMQKAILRNSPIRDNRGASGSGGQVRGSARTQEVVEPSFDRLKSQESGLPPAQAVESSGFASAMSPLPDDHQQPLFLPTPTPVQDSSSNTRAFSGQQPSDRALENDSNNDRGLGRVTTPRRTPSARNVKASSPALSVDFPNPQRTSSLLRSMEPNASEFNPFVPMSRIELRPDDRRAALSGPQVTNNSGRLFINNGGHAASRKDDPINDVDVDFERKRKMLRAAGVIDASSPPPATGPDSVSLPASRPSLASAGVRTPRFSATAPRKSRISSIFSPASFAGSPAVLATARASLRNINNPRTSVVGPNASTIPMTVAPDIELHLRKKAREHGFKYAEVAEQYFKEAGDLGRTMLWMENRVEAMKIILEDEEDGLEAEEAQERPGDQDDNLAGGIASEVKSDLNRNVLARFDAGRTDQDEDEEDEREEIVWSDFPPPRSEARAYQTRKIRLSLLS